jgi:hypothetical protein
LTPNTRRNETSDFGPSDWPTPSGHTPHDDISAYGDATAFGYDDPMAQTVPMLLADFGHDARDAGHQTEPGSSAAPVSRRQANARRKNRKRARRIVPAIAAAAALTAWAAAYVLVSAGHAGAGQQSASTTLQVSKSVSGIGYANAAASAPIEVAKARAHLHHHAYVRHRHGSATRAKASPPHGTVTQPATGSGGNTGGTSAAAPAASSSASSSTASTTASTSSSSTATKTSATTVSCGSGGLLPENVSAIVSFLLSHGYSHNAAAGIAGNIYQESKGNPESVGSGGGGLIGWTPLPAGFVTGNVSADLQTQLAQILKYNQGWSQFLPQLMSAASPSAAADIYVTDFERAGIPAASTRETSAQDVASACGI